MQESPRKDERTLQNPEAASLADMMGLLARITTGLDADNPEEAAVLAGTETLLRQVFAEHKKKLVLLFSEARKLLSE